MLLKHLDRTAKKGWYPGPWNSDLPISIGYATTGVDEPHLHANITEVYLVARGKADLRLERQTVPIRAGDMIVVEPGGGTYFYRLLSRLLPFCDTCPWSVWRKSAC